VASRSTQIQRTVSKETKILLDAYTRKRGIKRSTNKTVFPIASATKAFTGVALMQLVENGKLESG
jgi:CubicO group peptidase (beta-lactamase class C family)